MKKETSEIDFAFHTLLYRASIYARNRYLTQKHRQLIRYYGSLLEYSREEIDQHILENHKYAMAVRRRKEKTGMKYASKPA
ncbi:hypothetical protein SRRS_16170 [Sporomusa rhizae]|uniref:hypothetical protein n=1 Tax=Sporomusa rhizae TaxID=357999 RepID=UPI00352A848E